MYKRRKKGKDYLLYKGTNGMRCDMPLPRLGKSKGCQLEHFAAKLWDKEIIEFERLKYSKIWKEK